MRDLPGQADGSGAGASRFGEFMNRENSASYSYFSWENESSDRHTDLLHLIFYLFIFFVKAIPYGPTNNQNQNLVVLVLVY